MDNLPREILLEHAKLVQKEKLPGFRSDYVCPLLGYLRFMQRVGVCGMEFGASRVYGLLSFCISPYEFMERMEGLV
jgi:hypothetical protein